MRSRLGDGLCIVFLGLAGLAAAAGALPAPPMDFDHMLAADHAAEADPAVPDSGEAARGEDLRFRAPADAPGAARGNGPLWHGTPSGTTAAPRFDRVKPAVTVTVL